MTHLMEWHIRESNLIEDIDSPVADGAGLAAWEWLSQEVTELSLQSVRTLHRLATATQYDLAPEDRGVFRRCAVMVGGHVAPNPEHVRPLMEAWVRTFGFPTNTVADPWKAAKTAKASHVWFERIHPFVDGNGRTGRLLYWWWQHLAGLDATLIAASDRASYYGWFRNPRPGWVQDALDTHRFPEGSW